MNFKTCTIYLLLLLTSVKAISQTDIYIKAADSLSANYSFAEAKTLYTGVIRSSTDSLEIASIEAKIIQCENGINLLKYSSSPIVIANKKFPLDSFYLSLPGLKDKSWIPTPNHLSNKGEHFFYGATYSPLEGNVIYYSAQGANGAWNIYRTELLGEDLWSEPKTLNAYITSSGNELYPFISSDGKELYFSSDSHFGMGGFDLYVCSWNEETSDWGKPQNLGFPYSSTADDLMFYHTDDKRHTVVASNRYCPKDSISIIVSEYTSVSIKQNLSNIEEINSIARQLPSSNEKEISDIDKKVEDKNMDSYSTLVNSMRVIEQQIKVKSSELEKNRELYLSTENVDDKRFFSDNINKDETDLYSLRFQLDSVRIMVQEAELNFLSEGIIPDIDSIESEDVSEDDSPRFTFPSMTYGEARIVKFDTPAKMVDYSYKVLKKSEVFDISSLPQTLIYQVQILASNELLDTAKFKGMSPIFIRESKSGKYFYSVGLFKSYAQVSSNLSKIKSKGFPNASPIAFLKGENINLKDARIAEKNKKESYQIVFRGYPEGIPSSVTTTIQAHGNYKLHKIYENGEVIFIMDSFSKKKDAEAFLELLNSLDISGASLKINTTY